MKKRLIRVLLLLITLIVLPINAKAAVKFSITKEPGTNLKPGDAFTVTISASGVSEENSISGYKLTVTYDNNRLNFNGGISSSLSDISNSGNTVTINSKTWNEPASQTEDFKVGSFNFKVLSNAPSGSGNLTLVVNECEKDGEKTSCDANSASVNVVSLGTDASLSSLKIPNTTLKPAFNSNTTNYTASIKDITSLTVNASPTDSNAKVEITDNYRNLQKGENKINVVVTSEDGNNTKTYTVVVTLELTPTEEELLKADTTLKELVVKDFKIDFDKEEKKYYLEVPYKTISLDITATPTNEKATVKIEGNKKLVIGKNTVKIEVTSEDTNNKANYTIAVTRKDQEKKVTQTCPETTSTKEWIIYSISMLFTFTLGIVLGYFLCKKEVLKKLFSKKKKVEQPVEVETMSDTIDLSNTVKEVKKATIKEEKNIKNNKQ